LLLYLGYRLNRQRHKEIVTALAKQRAERGESGTEPITVVTPRISGTL
jgi:Na+/melibiose symporter-like transporter